MKPIYLLAAAVLLVGCSDSTGPDPDPEPEPQPDITGAACSVRSADCLPVTAHQIAVDSWRLWSQVAVDSAAFVCPVTSPTLDRAKIGTFWKCAWTRPA
jgi:PBP1b-binding outer membrane lipoprotein LpoB